MPEEEFDKSIKKMIENSGNSFHSRVVNLLRKDGWSVLVSPYYSDNFTDKPREIDIIAEKKFDVKDFHDWLGTVNVRLFIECKYIIGKTVFWFDQKDIERATERIIKDTGMTEPENNITITKHHYFMDVPIAKLFTSDSNRNEENEPINKAINQNLNATVYYRNRSDLKIVTARKQHIDRVLKRVSYPIIVVNSFKNFYRTDMRCNMKIEKITEPFQLEINYAYKDNNIFIDNHRGDNRNEYFLIDVVSLNKLITFLAFIEKTDIATIKNKIIFEKKINL